MKDYQVQDRVGRGVGGVGEEEEGEGMKSPSRAEPGQTEGETGRRGEVEER